MKLAIVMPVWIQNAAVLQMTYECLATVKTQYPTILYIVTNRLHGVTAAEFQAKCSEVCMVPVKVLHEDFVERSVAGAWNHGCRTAIQEQEDEDDGTTLLCLLANDILLEPTCLDRMVEFHGSPESAGIALWSGLHNGMNGLGAYAKHCDFSCVMFPRSTLDKHGWFDAGFLPAYFEDNDFIARVVLGGDTFLALTFAKFFHRGSATIRLDPEAAHHVDYWFGANRDRFVRKWGCLPVNTVEEIRAKYYKTPFNDSSKSLKDW